MKLMDYTGHSAYQLIISGEQVQDTALGTWYHYKNLSFNFQK